MKRRILALVCAMTMVLGMSMTVFASNSKTSSDTVDYAKQTFDVGGTQSFTAATIAEFAETTSVAGATVKAVSPEMASYAIAEANKIYGKNTFVATIVDISNPNATFPYTFTINSKNVWAGQKVTILHYTGKEWEQIKPNSVANNAVTLTTNSLSPFAIVIDASSSASPKTMDIALMVSGIAGLFTAGAVLTGKKKEQ